MSKKMRFFVQYRERECVDPNERAAMMRHRLKSIGYQAELLRNGAALYAFKEEDLSRTVLMFEIDALTTLDRLLKNDPLWPYSHVDTIPVLGTEEMTREIEQYLGEKILDDADYKALHWDMRPVHRDGEYWLAWKEVPPFNPLMSEEAQNDVYRRTAVSQRAHQSPAELNDENPIGKSVGILLYEGSMDSLLEHVTHCDVYRDSDIRFTRLEPLQRAWDTTVAQLRAKGWTVEEPAPAIWDLGPAVRVATVAQSAA
jgi:hypothetical protein